MKLYAISDLHVGFAPNRQALENIRQHNEDWLIIAGDIGETEEHLRHVLRRLTTRFARVIWAPGNHELWTTSPSDPAQLRGVAKYEHMVSICREYDVLTPEDPYLRWPVEGGLPIIIAPLFILYDYSFRPVDIPEDQAVSWAAETGVICTDEYLLQPDPFKTRSDWCKARLSYTEKRLEETLAGSPEDTQFILINHFPLREDLLTLGKIARFSLWCGTKRTEDWHIRFPVHVVVYGHLHVRRTIYRDGVRFEEVSIGYPRDWQNQNKEINMEANLREILPGQISRDA